MNQTYENEILNQISYQEENDENPQSYPSKDVDNNIYDEIEKEEEINSNHIFISSKPSILSKPIEVIIVDPKLFSNRCGCFFYSFF
jgi:hypothetical protein